MSNRSRKAQVWIGVAGRPGIPARVLLFQVLERRGGGWHPVTGGVEPGESFEEGAQRELLEETGFSAARGRWLDLGYAFQFAGRWGPAEERAFGLILRDSEAPVLDPNEHTAFEWVDLEEASGRLGFASQRDALKHFSCYLR